MKLLDEKRLSDMNLAEITGVIEGLGAPAFRARQLWHGIFKQRVSDIDAIAVLPKTLREVIIADGWHIGLPVAERQYLSLDGSIRYLMSFTDGQSVECVWMPEGDGGELGEVDREAHDICTTESRATICVSSQVGCAVGCRFCMTAQLGLQRNLTAGEIAGQVLRVLREQKVDLNKRRINIVFMGQGEPFLNYDNFIKAVHLLVEGAGLSENRMTVSTSGILPRINDFAAETIRPHLALSLNAPAQAAREELMPITGKWRLDELMAALRAYPLRPRERLTFEYVLLGGVNDSEEDAAAVAKLLKGMQAKVNLIAWNAGPEMPYQTPDPARVEAFQQRLIAAKIPAYLRRPRGLDVYAACGQLKKMAMLEGEAKA